LFDGRREGNHFNLASEDFLLNSEEKDFTAFTGRSCSCDYCRYIYFKSGNVEHTMDFCTAVFSRQSVSGFDCPSLFDGTKPSHWRKDFEG
jgi:hypothetical protein